MGKKNKIWDMKNKKYRKEREIIDNLKLVGVYDIFSNRTFTEETLLEKRIKDAKQTIKEKYG
jgi:hypothetical protein